MEIERLDPRAQKRLSGPSWAKSRPLFDFIHRSLIDVSPTVTGELTTIYIKYTEPGAGVAGKPFAVVWVKKAGEFIVGFSLLESDRHNLQEKVAGCSYAGLTGFLVVNENSPPPQNLPAIAKAAHLHRHA